MRIWIAQIVILACLLSCDDKKRIVNEGQDAFSTQENKFSKKMSSQKVSYNETTTFESDIQMTPYQTSIAIGGNRIDWGTHKPNVITKRVTVDYDLDGNPVISASSSDAPTESISKLLPFRNNQEMAYDGQSLTTKNFQGKTSSYSLPLKDEEELRKNFEQKHGGKAKRDSVKTFFQNFTKDSKKAFKNANKWFKKVEKLTETQYRFTDDAVDYEKEFVFDLDQKQVVKYRQIKDKKIIFESDFEFQTVQGRSFLRKSITHVKHSISEGKEINTKITKEISDIQFN